MSEQARKRLAWRAISPQLTLVRDSSTIFVHVSSYRIFTSALIEDDVAAIDAAGVRGTRQQTARTVLRRAAVVMLVGAAALRMCGMIRSGL